ncbi:uncharacterized protein EV420DRAFT_355373 [Desarmillaria tabescens]|uniref:Uncharacterized protein n=1 Tax=Armillaria tabescens TaxID=1929756 RepID=A0AA39N598_ARMTA|nr:uncharacterized protein EV420DRAFT_355373 [Desarmillaria tabescens]KAK0458432.1 hypothetical protein EV420DRAFT_355373 [Desarmillaria tabescens]
MLSSLNITLDSNPIAFQSTSVSLHRALDDPSDFVLSAFLEIKAAFVNTTGSVMVATTNQAVENFTADRIIDMTFNHSSRSENYILVAWESESGLRLAESQLFSVTDFESTASESALSTIPSSPPSSFSGSIPTSTTASNVPPKHTSYTGTIVGCILGLLAFGCMISAFIYVLIRRRRAKVATPYLCPEDGPAATLTSFPPKSRSMSLHQESETETQELVLQMPREHLEVENVRMREEIMVLDNQIRCMEAGCGSLPPPSYRSASHASNTSSRCRQQMF